MLQRFGFHFRHTVVTHLAPFFALVCAASMSSADVAVASAPGSLDLSFDGDGKAVTQIGSSTDQAHAIALQPDGRIVVAGFSQSGTGDRFAVVRYTTDGSLDTSFDGDGKVTTVVGAGHRDEGYAVALQPDGKIVVAGDSYDASGKSHFAVVRYNPDGSLDTSFDGDGKITTTFPSNGFARAVAVQGDGRIMVAGSASPLSSGGWPTLARYNPDGSLDTSFNDGQASTPSGTRVMTDGFGNSGVARALAIQDDGKIVVAGDAAHFNNRVMFVFRLEADGSSDLTFAGGGLAITDIAFEPNRATDLATAVDTLADGRIAVAGATQVGSGFRIAALRYRDNGNLDPTFGGDGIVTTAVGPVAQGFGVAVDDAGRTVVAGDGTPNGVNDDLALLRYGTDGSLDPAFDSDGIVTTPVGTAADQARGMALQPDGKIVVAGFSNGGTSQDDVVVARYHGDPPPDTTSPETTIDAGPSGPTNDPTPTFTFHADEPATFECSVDQGTPSYSACASGDELGPLPDGAYTFRVRATDAAGNTDQSPATRDFTVDTEAPETTIDAGPTGATTDSTPTFAFSSSESPSSFECRVDSGSFASCSSPHTTAPLANGSHTFQVRATDAAGNTDPSPASRSFGTCTGGLSGVAVPLDQLLRPINTPLADAVFTGLCSR